MWKGKKISWHRPDLSLRLVGEVANLELEDGEVRCAFPLKARAAGKVWALGVPLAQIRSPEVDIYVFEATEDGDGFLLNQAPQAGFDAAIRAVSHVPSEER